jgi:glutathione synthase/RimK-type ligase-like ATP-grasp enzyme
MAALQGCYCINNVFWRSADDKFLGYAAAEKLGIAEPKTVVLPNRSFVDDVTAESLRNLWPTDFQMYADHLGLPCIMKPAFGGGWKNVHKIHSLDELLHHYNASGSLTMMLQEFISSGHLHPGAHDRAALRARDPLGPRPRAGSAATTRTTTSCRARSGTRPRSSRSSTTRRSATT